MKKIIALLLCLVIIVSVVSGCGKTNVPEASPSDVSSGEVWTSPDEVENPPAPKAHIDFQPKVSSSFLEETFGKRMCDAWFNLVDAVMAGEDTFECPDLHIYSWVFAEFPDFCFPVLRDIIETVDLNYEDIEKTGRARFKYKVPKEEAAQKIEEFRLLVEDILNEVLDPDYTDLEKALALYRYFINTYEYDYDTLYLLNNEPEKTGYVCPYRLLTKKIGICSEVSEAYSYLLMQVGVEASVVMGDSKDGESHEWSLIKLGESYYHVDPTFGLGYMDCLRYFMMDDQKREEEGGFKKDGFTYVSIYNPEFPPDYTCNDKTFEPLWEGYLNSFDHDSKTIDYWKYDDKYEQEINCVFDYSNLPSDDLPLAA